MIQRILITMALFALFGMPVAYGQQSPEKVQKKVTQAMNTEAGVQKKLDDWEIKKQAIIDDIRDAGYKVTWYQYRQEKNRQYIANANKDIELLKVKKDNLFKLRDQLEVYLASVILRLEDFVNQDLPFLQDERQKRIDALKSSMDRTEEEVPLSEKLRQVFENGLQIEVQYGAMTDADDQVLTIDGIDTQVIVLRLGRLAKYYMTLDEEQTGYYNEATGQWEPLPKSMNRSISQAVDMAEQKRRAEIVNLPLGAVE